jgi:hypothetical protein
MMRLNRNDYNNIMSLQSHNHQIDQHDLTATRSSSAAEVISEPSHTTMHSNSSPRVNDAGAFLISSPHASLFSNFPNQQDDQYSYQPPYAPICTSTIDTAAATTNPTATPPNPTTGIIAFRAEVFSMVADERKPFVAKGGARESFPIKLFKMLEHIDLHEPELAKIVSWQPDERSFLVHGGAKKLEQQILPRFFKGQKQYASFRRQLNLWGFRRINQKGTDKGAYYHKMFVRGKPHLCRDMSLMAQTSLMARTQGSRSGNDSPRYDSTWGNVEEVKPRLFNTLPALAPAGKCLAPGAAEHVGETSNSASFSPGSSRSWISWLSEEEGEKDTASDQSTADSILFTLKNDYSAADLEPFSGNPPRMTQEETHNMLDFLGKISRL